MQKTYQLKVADRVYLINGVFGYDDFTYMEAVAARLVAFKDQAHHLGNKPIHRAGLPTHCYGVKLGDIVPAPGVTCSGLEVQQDSQRADYRRYCDSAPNVEFFDTICHCSTVQEAALVLIRNVGFGGSVLVTQFVLGSLEVPNAKMGDKITFPDIVACLYNWKVRFSYAILDQRWGIIDIPFQTIEQFGWEARPAPGVKGPFLTACVVGDKPAMFGGPSSTVNIMAGRILPKIDQVELISQDFNHFVLMNLYLGTRVFFRIKEGYSEAHLLDGDEKKEKSDGLVSDSTIRRYPLPADAAALLGVSQKRKFQIPGYDQLTDGIAEMFHKAHSHPEFFERRKAVDPYALVSFIPSGSKGKFASRAGGKLIEMFTLFPGLISSTTKVLHLGAAPGAMVEVCAKYSGWANQVVNFYRKGDCDLDPKIEQNLAQVGKSIIDGLGDITKSEDYAAMRFMGMKCRLVVADISPHFEENADPSYKESEHFELFKRECALTISTLAGGGNAILKFFGGNYAATAALVLMMVNFFEQVHICKPLLSRPTSSERFLVCRGFIAKRVGSDTAAVVEAWVDHWKFHGEVPFDISAGLDSYNGIIRTLDARQEYFLRSILDTEVAFERIQQSVEATFKVEGQKMFRAKKGE